MTDTPTMTREETIKFYLDLSASCEQGEEWGKSAFWLNEVSKLNPEPELADSIKTRQAMLKQKARPAAVARCDW